MTYLEPYLGEKFLKKALSRWLVFCLVATAAFSQTATVRRNSNLRLSPSSTAQIGAHLSAGTQVDLISKAQRGGYYHVKTEAGKKGWVWGRNVVLSEATGVVTPNMASNAFRKGSLAAQLHAAQVAAVAQPLVVGGRTVCNAEGDSEKQRIANLDTQKNRVDI